MATVEFRLGDQVFFYDREATLAAYSSLESFAGKCGCAGCRNFAAQRGTVYPPNFRALLDRLGIDPMKEAEAVHDGAVSPGIHSYEGWFHFIGSLQDAGESAVEENGFTYFVRKAHPPPPLREHSVLALEFSTKLPWVLPEPPSP